MLKIAPFLVKLSYLNSLILFLMSVVIFSSGFLNPESLKKNALFSVFFIGFSIPFFLLAKYLNKFIKASETEFNQSYSALFFLNKYLWINFLGMGIFAIVFLSGLIAIIQRVMAGTAVFD